MKKQRLIPAAVLVAAAIAGGYWYTTKPNDTAPVRYLTELVEPQTLTLRASGSGTVTTLYNDYSDRVTVQIGERDIAKVHEDQKATVSLDAFEGTFEGTVYSIAERATGQGTTTTYDVVIKVPELPRGTYLDMTANADITLKTIPKALTVPANAIQVKGGTNVVEVLVGDKPQRRTVTLGEQGDTMVQVLTGLKAGDRVITGIDSDVTSEASGFGPPRDRENFRRGGQPQDRSGANVSNAASPKSSGANG